MSFRWQLNKIKYFLTGLVASLVLATISVAESLADDSSAETQGNPVRSCQLADSGQVLRRVGDTLCVRGHLRHRDLNEDLIDSDLKWVVAHSGGGDLGAYISLASSLRGTPASVIVPHACTSACAMVLMPSAKRLFVHQDAVIAIHRHFFSSVEEYRQYKLSDPRRPVPTTDAELNDQLTMIDRAFERFQERVIQLEALLNSEVREVSIVGKYYEMPACYDHTLGFATWDYYTLVDQSYYEGLVDTDNWVWPQRTTQPSTEGFSEPICAVDGNLFFAPPKSR